MEHGRLVKLAVDAIAEVFGDTSVDPATTKSSLEELRDEIDLLLACLREDGAS